VEAEIKQGGHPLASAFVNQPPESSEAEMLTNINALTLAVAECGLVFPSDSSAPAVTV
jgi:hypothetical protein